MDSVSDEAASFATTVEEALSHEGSKLEETPSLMSTTMNQQLLEAHSLPPNLGGFPSTLKDKGIDISRVKMKSHKQKSKKKLLNANKEAEDPVRWLVLRGWSTDHEPLHHPTGSSNESSRHWSDTRELFTVRRKV
ncbi:hypothetical protein SELMODRAFT_414711 [Selaginella moellendorffii]|uniref:Uncharacterized protein n=1 Tax=Selaginella moellendorffii TaxID=88036 RepID=D8RTP0_SELML|nr:hypothetical protein SELMODRAFT_414711 [Selaginella moellendorffii]